MKKFWDWESDTEYRQLINDLLAKREVQALAYYQHHHFSNRLEHSLHVSYRAYRLAKLMNLDVRSVARAGLLHDLFYYDWRDVKFEAGSHAYMHPRIALANAREITDISDKEADIILKHMFGATLSMPKYPESWLVNLVDDYSAINEYALPRLFYLYQDINRVMEKINY